MNGPKHQPDRIHIPWYQKSYCHILTLLSSECSSLLGRNIIVGKITKREKVITCIDQHFRQLLFVQRKSITLMYMKIPREVRWALGSTMIYSLTTLRNFNNMPKIFRTLNIIEKHSVS